MSEAPYMIVVNMSHPLTDTQLDTIREAVGIREINIHAIPVHFDTGTSFDLQTDALFEQLDIKTVEWQTIPILINLPAHSVISALVLGQVAGRMGRLPWIVRLAPPTSIGAEFTVAELINVQAVRDTARGKR